MSVREDVAWCQEQRVVRTSLSIQEAECVNSQSGEAVSCLSPPCSDALSPARVHVLKNKMFHNLPDSATSCWGPSVPYMGEGRGVLLIQITTGGEVGGSETKPSWIPEDQLYLSGS